MDITKISTILTNKQLNIKQFTGRVEEDREEMLELIRGNIGKSKNIHSMKNKNINNLNFKKVNILIHIQIKTTIKSNKIMLMRDKHTQIKSNRNKVFIKMKVI